MRPDGTWMKPARTWMEYRACASTGNAGMSVIPGHGARTTRPHSSIHPRSIWAPAEQFVSLTPAPPCRAKVITATQPHAANSPLILGAPVVFAFLKERGVFVIKIVQLHSLDFLSNKPLDGRHMAAILGQ